MASLCLFDSAINIVFFTFAHFSFIFNNFSNVLTMGSFLHFPHWWNYQKCWRNLSDLILLLTDHQCTSYNFHYWDQNLKFALFVPLIVLPGLKRCWERGKLEKGCGQCKPNPPRLYTWRQSKALLFFAIYTAYLVMSYCIRDTLCQILLENFHYKAVAFEY